MQFKQINKLKSHFAIFNLHLKKKQFSFSKLKNIPCCNFAVSYFPKNLIRNLIKLLY